MPAPYWDKKAASENTVTVLRQAIARFGTLATILSDNGSCFLGIRNWEPRGSESQPRLSRSFRAEESSL